MKAMKHLGYPFDVSVKMILNLGDKVKLERLILSLMERGIIPIEEDISVWEIPERQTGQYVDVLGRKVMLKCLEEKDGGSTS